MSQPQDTAAQLSARPDRERRYREALISPAWDVGDGSAPKFRYAVLSLPRTGSEFLCASLRRRGIGVPQEYLSTSSIAKRLGCQDEAGNTALAPYLDQLHARRTTPNGIFGIELHALHLKAFAGEDIRHAAAFLNGFDRIFVLRRRDKLLQVISLCRAHLTGQFHIMPGDAERPLTQVDATLFGLIATHLANILNDERYVAGVLGLLAPAKITPLWYEDVTESVASGLARELAAGAGYFGPLPELRADHDLPRRGNTEEALRLKQRFLSYIVGEDPLIAAPAAPPRPQVFPRVNEH